MSNHLFKCKHPTKQNPNIWSSLGKLSYIGLFISINLFISVLDVSKTLDSLKKSLKHIVLGNSWSIFHWQLTDIPPTLFERSPYRPSVDHHTGKMLTDSRLICQSTGFLIYWSIYCPIYWLCFGQYFDRHVSRVLVDMSVVQVFWLREGVHKLCKILIFRGVCSIHLTGWPTDKLTNWLFVWLIFWLTKGS